MQHEKNPLNWFIHMVDKGIFNPLNPDMGLIPGDILNQMLSTDDPDEAAELSPAVLNVAHFLFIACKITIQKRKGRRTPRNLTVTASEVFTAQERFLLLVTLESLKREGLLEYQTRGSWHDRNAEIAIVQLHPYPQAAVSSPMKKNISYVQ